MEQVKLIDICLPKQWKTIPASKLKEEGYLVYGANGLIGYYDQYTHEGETLMITCRGATCGTLNISKPYSYINGNAMALDNLDISRVNLKYLYYFLKARGFNDVISGSAQPQITRTSLKNVSVLLPSLDEQERIADILDKLDYIINKRKESIEKLDGLPKILFRDMFGETFSTCNSIEFYPLDEVCSEIYRYPTFYGLKYKAEGSAVIRIGNILSNGIVDPDMSNYVYIDSDISEKYPRTIIEYNDIVMAVRGDGSTAKRIGIINSKNLINANISPNLLRIKANIEKVNPKYLFYFLTSDIGQKKLESYIKRTAKKNITATDVKKIELFVPSKEVQDKFEKIVSKIEYQTALKKRQLIRMEEINKAFIQEAFKRQLN
ncbi:restriction endonuclease subunit S [Domibacillus mangrovi]|uniref:Type I restriction modification DNA specificity domain-containing protein n=1 Tax=Domibacillus mangrovi TaxID=1714354 RepID=A0A1Q5P3J1_9BACI|nr:restriction endonuclease subunit S [Domibacillus mangrovi]OKL36692.1 hypothetical protein BLL40_08110 [Domibacillus mangrovi]